MTIQSLSPGIYFGLAPELYHNDPALSRTDIGNLIDTPRTYWDNSYMNPERKLKEQSPEMEYGEAFHTLLFEPKEFERRWMVWPIDEYNAGKKRIERKEYFKIVESIKVLREGADSGMFLGGDGVGEVTIVFEDDGLMHRCRHDYFLPHLTVDFKTTHALHDEALKRAFRTYNLDVQASLYLRSRKRFKEQFRNGQASVYGKVPKEFFERFMAEQMNEFLFIFQRTIEPYPYEPLMPSNDTIDSGEKKIFDARKLYRRYMQEYGPQRRWPACTGKTREFSMWFGKREPD